MKAVLRLMSDAALLWRAAVLCVGGGGAGGRHHFPWGHRSVCGRGPAHHDHHACGGAEPRLRVPVRHVSASLSRGLWPPGEKGGGEERTRDGRIGKGRCSAVFEVALVCVPFLLTVTCNLRLNAPFGKALSAPFPPRTW